jgi:small subunit ribosomal protein S1
LANEGKHQPSVRVKIGAPIQGKVLTVSERDDGDVMIDLGNKLVGMLPRIEAPEIKVGDTLQAIVIGRHGSEVQLSKNATAALKTEDALREAFANKLGVRGKVTGENKGGFTVSIQNREAFCPVSQMDLRFVTDKAFYIGKDFDFIIEKMAGKDMVVSRRAQLLQQRGLMLQNVAALWKEKPDTVFSGVVSEVRDYGAIVGFEGIEGMVHVSELQHGRVARAADVVKVSESVRFKILQLDTTTDPPRISLSMKAVAQNPWDTIDEDFSVGQSYPGRITRLENFGAFVELKPGIEGVVHVSEMSWTKRVHHPSEILKVGEQVTVRLLGVDHERGRISLSLKDIGADPWADSEQWLKIGGNLTGTVTSLKGFGAIVELKPGITGLVPKSVLEKAYGTSFRKEAGPQKQVQVVVRNIDKAQKRVLLSLPQVGEDDDNGAKDYQEYLAESGIAPKKKPEGATGSFGELLLKAQQKRT